MMEGLERAGGLDGQLEEVVVSGVVDRDGDRVRRGIPQEPHLDAATRAGGELPGLAENRAGHAGLLSCIGYGLTLARAAKPPLTTG